MLAAGELREGRLTISAVDFKTLTAGPGPSIHVEMILSFRVFLLVMSSNQVTTYIALTAASLTIGYWIGVGSSLPFSRSSASYTQQSARTELNENEDEASPQASSLEEELKMVIVVRTDLGMSTGKIAAHHAALACYKTLERRNTSLLRQWERTGQTKIALRCNNEYELEQLEASARTLNVCAKSIFDAGRTQIAAGSRTVLGIGPGPSRLINQITGTLKLL